MNRLFLLLFFSSCFYCTDAQVKFYDASEQVFGDREIYSTIGFAIDDINGDDRDDIIALDDGKILKTFTQQGNQEPFKYKLHAQTSVFGDWSIVSGDLDNDGFPEVLSSGAENGTDVMSLVNEKYTLQYNTIDIYSQTSNLVDLNQDGYLDLFVCNDIGESMTYINDGTGQLVQETIIDFKTGPDDDMSGNYSSIFTDIDNDGDLDLYIGKCRAGVTDTTDRRRVNTLYINEGNGGYTEQAASFNLDSGAQSWSVDFGDVDNDGDTDAIIANHDMPHELMINDGQGHFTRYDYLVDKVESFALQSFFIDFDNNGWLDIFITDNSSSVILYNYEMNFVRENLNINGEKAFSAAAGDFNEDGFVDLILSFADGYQDSGEGSDVIFMNEGNQNNHVTFTLVGTESNRDAIGAKVQITDKNGNVQMREIHAGLSYGIMNSTNAYFGIGRSEMIDEIRIFWPSGNVTILDDDYDVNTHYTISEDGCFTQKQRFSDQELCTDSNPIFEAAEADSYLWSSGGETMQEEISEAGSYYLTSMDDGCKIESYYFDVLPMQDYDGNEIVDKLQVAGCENELPILTATSGLAYEWSTGDTTQVIETANSGLYSLTLTTNCGTYPSSEVAVVIEPTQVVETETDTVEIGDSATISALGENPSWYANPFTDIKLFTGNEFTTGPLFDTTVFYVELESSGMAFTDNLLAEVPAPQANDTNFVENESLAFDVYDFTLINSVSVYTTIPGNRKITIFDDAGILHYSRFSNLSVGENQIDIQTVLPAGSYLLSTDSEANMLNFGHPHPALTGTSSYQEEEKYVQGYIKIGSSNLQEGRVPYFFDWDVSYGYYGCKDRVPVIVIVNESTSTAEIENENIILYPNPSPGRVTVQSDWDFPYDLALFNQFGVQVDSRIIRNMEDAQLDLNVASGIYFIVLQNNRKKVFSKLVITK